MSRDDHAVKFEQAMAAKTNITALKTLPQGWNLAQPRTTIMAVCSESLSTLRKSCTGNKH